MGSKWMKGNLIMYPQAAGYGVEYCVDSVNGNDNNSGFDWGHAKKLLSATITASNTYIAITKNANKRNKIYIGGGMLSEVLTTLPNQCDIIGVGNRTAWSPLINGVMTIGTAVNSCHFWNIGFFSNTSAPLVTIPSGSHGIGFHQCEFINGGSSVTHGLHITNCNSIVIDNNMFVGNPVLPIGIYFAGPLWNSCKITNNFISATTVGIYGHTNITADFQSLIGWNVICRADPNGFNYQLTHGISFNTDSASNYMIVGNWISATDAIKPDDSAGVKRQFMCIGNLVNQGTNAGIEDGVTNFT